NFSERISPKGPLARLHGMEASVRLGVHGLRRRQSPDCQPRRFPPLADLLDPPFLCPLFGFCCKSLCMAQRLKPQKITTTINSQTLITPNRSGAFISVVINESW